MRLILMTFLLCFSIVLFGQEEKAQLKPENVKTLTNGYLVVEAFDEEMNYIGDIPLSVNIGDTTLLNKRPKLYRKVNITYALDKRWSRFSQIYNAVIMTDDMYTSGNGLLLDLLGQIPEDHTQHLDNSKRQSITIIWTGPIPVNGKVLSTRTPGWDKGVVYLKK